jgi:DNA repair ATPase RecN
VRRRAAPARARSRPLRAGALVAPFDGSTPPDLSLSKMGKSEKRKAPEPDTVLEHGNGTILKVRVTNFMCHQHLEVELGPRINFIVGENGSGKSAVLTALMVCLGTKKGAKERSDKGLKGFIREGSNFAKVEVSIRNVGNDAFEPQMNHGDVITVERTISASGSGSFKIRNKAGKEIGSSREMLLRMMDHFNIDVDNPIVVMTQDSSRQFLHSGKDTDKYKFFVKATLLEDIQVKLQWIKEQVKEMDALIEAKEQELPTLQTNVENLEKEAESFQKMEEFVKEQEQWRNRLAWSEVYKVEKDMAELEVELDSYRGTHTTELAQQRRKTEEQLEQSKTNLAEVKARLTECTEKTSQAKNDLEAAKVKRAQLAGQAKREDTSILSHNNEIRSMEQEKEMLEKELEESRALMQQQSQAQDISLQRAVDAAREHRDKLKREMDAAVANAHELPRKKRDAEGEKMRAESAIREADQNFRNCENSLKEARNERGGILVKFGQNMPKLAEALKKHAAQFEKPPLGPIGVYVKLKGPELGEGGGAARRTVPQSLPREQHEGPLDPGSAHALVRRASEHHRRQLQPREVHDRGAQAPAQFVDEDAGRPRVRQPGRAQFHHRSHAGGALDPRPRRGTGEGYRQEQADVPQRQRGFHPWRSHHQPDERDERRPRVQIGTRPEVGGGQETARGAADGADAAGEERSGARERAAEGQGRGVRGAQQAGERRVSKEDGRAGSTEKGGGGP